MHCTLYFIFQIMHFCRVFHKSYIRKSTNICCAKKVNLLVSDPNYFSNRTNTHERLLLRHYHRNYRRSFEFSTKSWTLAIGGLVGGLTLAAFWKKFYFVAAESAKDTDTLDLQALNKEIPGLPSYSSEEIAKHDCPETGIWVSFQSGVYDITKFISLHPGGKEKIKIGFGGALEPFWELYAFHKTKQVLAMLEEYRIGNLDLSDRGQALKDMDDPYANDPKRYSILKPISKKPFNAEPPMEILTDNFITPNEMFFVRNHLPVPEVNVSDYSLEIESDVGEMKPISLSLEDLKSKFTKHTIVTAIQCAGNRRSELNKVKEVKGLNWGSAAISNAEWSGARLIDVLEYCGVDFKNVDYKHVQFEGLDADSTNTPYGASIPVHKAFDRSSDVLLAYEMNGVPIPRDHGYPVRVIVPGVVGARNVKWLSKITLSQVESSSQWQQNDYKGFSPNIDWSNVDFKSSPAIQELPVNSAICRPTPNETVTLKNGKIEAKGYAWSGGGRKIVRVDVSADGGKNWTTAELVQEKTPLQRTWSWTIWKAEIPIDSKLQNGGQTELIVKAIDSSYNVQPDTVAPIWNLRGVLCNSWHRVPITVRTV